MDIVKQEFKNEVNVIILFGILASVGYYFWLKNKKSKNK